MPQSFNTAECVGDIEDVENSVGHTCHGAEHMFPSGKCTPDCEAGYTAEGEFACEKDVGFVSKGAACTGEFVDFRRLNNTKLIVLGFVSGQAVLVRYSISID